MSGTPPKIATNFFGGSLTTGSPSPLPKKTNGSASTGFSPPKKKSRNEVVCVHQPAMPNDPKCDPLNLLHLATEAFDMKDISVNFASMSPSTDFGRVLQPGTNNSVPNRELGLATMSASIQHVGVDTGQDAFIDVIPSGFTPNNIEEGEPTDHQSSLQEEPLESGAIVDPLFDSV